VEKMNYFNNSTSANQDLSASCFSGKWTAEPAEYTYILKDFNFIPLSTTLYRLNMPLLSDPNMDKNSTSPGVLKTTDSAQYPAEDKGFDALLHEAIDRYKDLHHVSDLDTAKANKFLSALKSINNIMRFHPYIIFNKFAAKVQMNMNDKEFVIDYDYNDPNSVIILSKGKTLFIKECILDKIEETLRSF
jgi:hypothetical protein